MAELLSDEELELDSSDASFDANSELETPEELADELVPEELLPLLEDDSREEISFDTSDELSLAAEEETEEPELELLPLLDSSDEISLDTRDELSLEPEPELDELDPELDEPELDDELPLLWDAELSKVDREETSAEDSDADKHPFDEPD